MKATLGLTGLTMHAMALIAPGAFLWLTSAQQAQYAGTTAVNVAINVIQISALLIFSVIALGYRMSHSEGSVGLTLDPDGTPTQLVYATDKDGKPVKDKDGAYVTEKDEAGKDKLVILS